VSPVQHLARQPREPRERGVARGHLAPSGKNPAHPANPARPFRGAGSRAGSGGLAATAAARPDVADRRSRGFCGGDGRAAGPHRAAVPGGLQGAGGPPTAASRDSATGPISPSRLPGAVTLSNENALSRFRASPDAHPPACGPERAAQGSTRGSLGRTLLPPPDRCRTYGASGVPPHGLDSPFPLLLPPYGGVERPRRVVRLARLIDRRGRVLGGPSVRAASGGV